MTTTSSSLTLRAVLQSAATRAGIGARATRVSGLSPQAQAFYVASTARAGTVLLVVSSDALIAQASADVSFFLAALEGLSPGEVERAVLPFPSHEVDPYRGLAPHFDVASARARALHALIAGQARVVIASARALMPRVSAPARLLDASVDLAPGADLPPDTLADLFADAGFSREDPVDEHGEFCVRGGVVDVFPGGDAQPIRLEFIGDTIESIRRFDPATQRSVATLDRVQIVPLREVFPVGGSGDPDPAAEDRSATVFDYLAMGRSPVLFVAEEDDVRAQIEKGAEQLQVSYADVVAARGAAPPPETLTVSADELWHRLERAVRLEELGLGEPTELSPHGDRHIASQPAVEFRGRIRDWVDEIRQRREQGATVVFVAASPGRAERIVEMLAEYDLLALSVERAERTHAAAVLVATAHLSRGFYLPSAGLQLYAETDVFGEERKVHERRRSVARTFLSDFRDLKVGDLVVHVDNGIGVFVGLKQIPVGVELQEFMELRYAGDDKLFVPVERLDLVQKYSGASRPALDRLGGTTWEKAKTRVKKAMRDMAEELLKLYAARRAVPGHAFSSDSHWQEEFEGAFEYELTVDQQAAIADIKKDMEAPTPMDRLLCGDVGYGKTEVAMRAAFKAVMDGKQVAFLAPTTVLAFQHLKTLKDRFAAFPVRIDMVSRFRTKAEQKQTLTDLSAGKVEVLVGTHRLLSKDVQFRDLGLLIVDEEQRFGVVHKERIKQIKKRVDVLTMTATPIPRTLNMSLVGIRDMSVIETPPRDRLSIQTNVVKFDQQVIARAITTELERGGQVYFVHNRVESIYSMAGLIARLVPGARIGVGHGQMGEDALEKVMVDFVARTYDVLLATTIIENGLDIPNANTMIINRADRYGLAQLYQLRGRVGRSDRRAYAYLLIPAENTLSPVARKRLAAIKEFSDLGSGFRIAALDLEIRGAGNLLGGEQSGHIEAIGFEMYMKLLEDTVRELKGEDLDDDLRAAVNLRVDLRIDEDYIPDMNQRLGIYRRIASSRSVSEIDRILEELRDRYGPVPSSVLNLAEYGRIRVAADRLGVESIDREGQTVVFKFRPDAKVDPGHLFQFVSQHPEVTLTPPAVVKLDLRRVPGRTREDPRGKPAGPGKPGRPLKSTASGSWWTARATAGEVVPGFTKEEILRPEREDPRGPDGVFTRVAGLLAMLSGPQAMS